MSDVHVKEQRVYSAYLDQLVPQENEKHRDIAEDGDGEDDEVAKDDGLVRLLEGVHGERRAVDHRLEGDGLFREFEKYAEMINLLHILDESGKGCREGEIVWG